MKPNLAKASLIFMALLGSSAFAEGKAATRIDFNKMIDENNVHRNELQENLKAASNKEPQRKMDRSKVIDFIDVEVGVGQTPAVSDRRFDSTSAPLVVEVEALTK